ncbi:MAG: RidA family protein, partial [Gimesia chilikensis]
MKSLTNLLTAVALLALTGSAAAEVAYLNPSAETGTSQCAVVKNSVLAHTSQILPINFNGGQVAAGNAGDQTALVLQNLDYLLGKVDATLYRIVKLNVYVAREELVSEVKQRLVKELKFKVQPACTFVVTKLADPKALVAMDVVAALDSDKKIAKTEIYNDNVSGFR